MQPFSFKDSAGDEWSLDITGATVKAIKAVLSVNILDLIDFSGEVYQRYATDPIFLVDLVSVVCGRQISERKISEEDFAALLGCDALAEASTKLLEAVVNFVPNLAARRVASLTVTKAREVQDKIADVAVQRIEAGIDAAAKMAMAEVLGKGSTVPSSTAAESSESHPEA